jgi:hypothetical protein
MGCPSPLRFFASNTNKTVPPNYGSKTMCINTGWDLAFNENHWSILETTK